MKSVSRLISVGLGLLEARPHKAKSRKRLILPANL
jgi:hypothetical protein